MVPMWMHPVAIACGNTFVLKPSERDPSASKLRRPAVAARPACRTASSTSCTATRSRSTRSSTIPDIAAVSFVGSTPIARYIHEQATATGKRVQALGGAKNHAIVLPDADLDFAADHLAAAAFGSAGERCMAISAAVAVGGAGDALVDVVSAQGRARSWSAPAATPRSEMGPVVTAAAKERIESPDRHRRAAGRQARRSTAAAWSSPGTRTASSSARP